MAKTTAPLLGFGASGQIGKSQVYARWKGVTYARRHVVPANPQTTSQMQTRHVFRFLSAFYKVATVDIQASWKANAKGNPVTDRNALAKANVAALRTQTTLNAMTLLASANGGIAPLTVTPTPSTTSVSFAVTTPTPPTGWTLTDIVVAMVKQQDPHLAGPVATFSHASATSPCVVSGLVTGTSYQYSAQLVWTKADASLAYSPAISGQVTTS